MAASRMRSHFGSRSEGRPSSHSAVFTVVASRIAQPEKLRLAYAEYGEGDYERSFSLTDDFDPDKIEASMQDGVLTLLLPRAAAVLPKKITVTSA